MKKRSFSNQPCPISLIDKTFERWCVNLDELVRQHPSDQKLKILAQGLTEALAAIFIGIENDEPVGLIITRQGRLPDYDTDDSEYGEPPF